MAYASIMNGFRDMLANGEKIECNDALSAQKLCRELYNNYGVCNQDLADVCQISSVMMHTWRNKDIGEAGNKLTNTHKFVIREMQILMKMLKQQLQDEEKIKIDLIKLPQQKLLMDKK